MARNQVGIINVISVLPFHCYATMLKLIAKLMLLYFYLTAHWFNLYQGKIGLIFFFQKVNCFDFSLEPTGPRNVTSIFPRHSLLSYITLSRHFFMEIKPFAWYTNYFPDQSLSHRFENKRKSASSFWELCKQKLLLCVN